MLVEARRSKTLFLRKIIQDIKLSNVDVVHSRLEDLSQEIPYSGFTSRATLPLGPTLLISSNIIKTGGYAFLWKGSNRQTEMEADQRWKANWDLDRLLGLGGGQTVVARFKRT
jgi:16S rRNA G527 N7-methylase RsmG